METARAQFLNTPELLSLVTTYLAPMDISRLCQTSHRMHETCTPSLYRDLFISSCFEKEQTIFASTPCRHAFRRNIGHVRSLTIGPIELHYYYNCLRMFEETRPHNLDASATLASTSSSSASSSSSQIPPSSLPQSPTSSPSLPRWLPPAVHRTHPVEPLPPMTNLQHLVLTDNNHMDCSYRLPKFNDDRMIMAECCWIISLNPRLEHLSSNYNTSLNVLGYRLLATAVSGLSRLTTLDISVLCHANLKFKAGAEILFSCCPSIRKIKIVTADSSFDYSSEFLDCDPDDAIVEDDVDWLVGTTRKLEPLVNLEELDFWDVMDSASTDDLLTVFEHCPNIQKLNVLTISDLYDHDVLGEFIGQKCPKIRSLTCGSPFVGLEVGGPLLFKIMDSLPAQTVEDIYFYGAFDGFIETSLTLATLRHSTTLSRIEIEWIYPLAKVSLSAIFEECVNLEKLDVRCKRCWGRIGLYTTLANVLERPWNTSKLADLSLSISVNDLPVVLQAQEQTQRAVAISELRQAHSGRLDELTRRVMSLPGGQGIDVKAGIVTVEDEDQLVFTKIE